MPILIDHFNSKYPNEFPKPKVLIELEINLVKKDQNFDYCPYRADYLNWIPFEFRFQIGEHESHVYPADYGATFSFEELKYFFPRMDTFFEKISLIDPKSEKAWEERLEVNYFTMECYFGLDFNFLVESPMDITVWITSLIPNSNKDGVKRGFQYVVDVDDAKTFITDLKTQLKDLITNRNCNNCTKDVCGGPKKK